MKQYLGCVFGLLTAFSWSQNYEEIITKIEAHRVSENEYFSNPETTILELKDAENFNGLEFYPIDLHIGWKHIYLGK